MKKLIYAIIAVAVAGIFFFAGLYLHSLQQPVTVYKETEEKIIKVRELDKYLADGWYDERVVRIYSQSGENMLVKESEIAAKGEEWGQEPFVKMYSTLGEEVYAPQSQIEEYKAVGWYEKRPDWEGLSDLKEQIEGVVSSSWGVFVQNLDTNEFLVINEKPFVSASIVKLYTMATTYAQIEAGTVEKTDEVMENLRSMITVSSNEACNYLTRINGGGKDLVGYDRENELSKSLGCENTVRGSYIVDESRRRGSYRTQNKTSPRDCGRLLKAIYNKELVSEAASEEMLSLLLDQQRVWKIPAALPEGTKIANKTGETNNVNSDVAIVFSEGADYILCMLGNGSKAPGVGTIHTVSKMVYDYFNQ